MKYFKPLAIIMMICMLCACKNDKDITATENTAIDFNKCSENFFQGQPPQVSEKLAKNSQPLCFNGFAVLYSGISKTPIWSAEYLTRQRLTFAKKLERVDNFHEESRLPENYRSFLKDYSNSGFDRGHLAPNGDMSNKNAQYDSFSLANIAPQNPTNNRKTWVKIENKTRDLTEKHGKGYVVTGVVFLSDNVKKLNNNVFVPSHFFKAVYIPNTQQAIAYLSPNDDSEKVETLTINELQERTGIDAFPNLDNQVKNTKVNLQ